MTTNCSICITLLMCFQLEELYSHYDVFHGWTNISGFNRYNNSISWKFVVKKNTLLIYKVISLLPSILHFLGSMKIEDFVYLVLNDFIWNSKTIGTTPRRWSAYDHKSCPKLEKKFCVNINVGNSWVCIWWPLLILHVHSVCKL